MKFTFIDLFSGIGAFHQVFSKLGGQCVFASDIDKFARLVYKSNYDMEPHGDITKIDPLDIPNHDILCAGFPCQPFSVGGLAAKVLLGQKHGFECEAKGTLFFNVKEIIKAKRPKVIFLENVQGLEGHDKGRTFSTIKSILQEECGYIINYKVVNGLGWLPQNRERIFIIGYDACQFNIGKDDIIIPSNPEEGYIKPQLSSIINPDEQDFALGEGTWSWLQKHTEKNKQLGKGFSHTLHRFPLQPDEYVRTITSRYHKDGSECLIERPSFSTPRKLSITELKDLFGFPKEFTMPVSNTQAYRQFGNCIMVPPALSSAKEIINALL